VNQRHLVVEELWLASAATFGLAFVVDLGLAPFGGTIFVITGMANSVLCLLVTSSNMDAPLASVWYHHQTHFWRCHYPVGQGLTYVTPVGMVEPTLALGLIVLCGALDLLLDLIHFLVSVANL
jgi:hypothetical protein